MMYPMTIRYDFQDSYYLFLQYFKRYNFITVRLFVWLIYQNSLNVWCYPCYKWSYSIIHFVCPPVCQSLTLMLFKIDSCIFCEDFLYQWAYIIQFTLSVCLSVVLQNINKKYKIREKGSVIIFFNLLLYLIWIN